MEIKHLFAALILVVLVVVGFTLLNSNQKQLGVVGDTHTHADFKVFLNGVEHNFSQSKYMSRLDNALSPFMHLHDMDGGVMHQHISGATLGLFFDSLGIEFTPECFILDTGEEYCNTDENELRMYVNGVRNYEFENYEFNDLDRILITYGSDESIINSQMDLVSDRACIQSEVCPERGEPYEESECVGGDGTSCGN